VHPDCRKLHWSHPVRLEVPGCRWCLPVLCKIWQIGIVRLCPSASEIILEIYLETHLVLYTCFNYFNVLQILTHLTHFLLLQNVISFKCFIHCMQNKILMLTFKSCHSLTPENSNGDTPRSSGANLLTVPNVLRSSMDGSSFRYLVP